MATQAVRPNASGSTTAWNTMNDSYDSTTPSVKALRWFLDKLRSEDSESEDSDEQKDEDNAPNLTVRIWAEILTNLNATQLANARLVCHRWKRIIDRSPSLVGKFVLSFPHGTTLDKHCELVRDVIASGMQHTQASLRKITLVGAAAWWPAVGGALISLTIADCKIPIDMLLDVLKLSPNWMKFEDEKLAKIGDNLPKLKSLTARIASPATFLNFMPELAQLSLNCSNHVISFERLGAAQPHEHHPAKHEANGQLARALSGICVPLPSSNAPSMAAVSVAVASDDVYIPDYLDSLSLLEIRKCRLPKATLHTLIRFCPDPKSKSSSQERLRRPAEIPACSSEDDDDDDDPCISRSSPECHGTECDHGAEGGHDHFHLRAGSTSSADFRSKSSLRNDRYKCFGLLESNILNSFQLQNFRWKIGSGYDSANSPGQISMIEDVADTIEEIGKLDTNIHSLMYKSVEVHKDIVVECVGSGFESSKKFNSMVVPHFSPWRPPRTGQ
ncbi:hypothetical protein quinque_014280 [Culex quinquefasciatus]